MGGGRQKFLPNSTLDQGQRQDGRNLIKEWLDIERAPGAKKAFVGDRSQLKSLKTGETDYMLGKEKNNKFSIKNIRPERFCERDKSEDEKD